MAEEKFVEFGIKDLKLIDFQLTPAIKELEEPALKKFEFHFQLQTKVTPSTESFDINLLTTFLYKSESGDIELGHLRNYCSFFIVNFKESVKMEGGKPQVPKMLFPPTIGIAISSARGMLAVCLKDTIISNAIIPIVDPQQFIPK